jgi:hypothetical protein
MSISNFMSVSNFQHAFCNLIFWLCLQSGAHWSCVKSLFSRLTRNLVNFEPLSKVEGQS